MAGLFGHSITVSRFNEGFSAPDKPAWGLVRAPVLAGDESVGESHGTAYVARPPEKPGNYLLIAELKGYNGYIVESMRDLAVK